MNILFGASALRLFSLPGLDRGLVLLELVTPVRVDLLVIVGLGGRGATMRVHGYVIGAEQRPTEPAIVPARVLFAHAHNDQTLLRGLNELIAHGTVLVGHLIASLLLAVVIPPDLPLPQHLRHLGEAAQMHRLAPSDDELAFTDAVVADSLRAVGHVLQQTRLVGSAPIRVFVPSAVGIANASQTVVVATGADHQVDLLDATIRGDVEGVVFRGNLHGLDVFAGSSVEDVEQTGAVFPLDDFVHPAVGRSGVIDRVFGTEDVHYES